MSLEITDMAHCPSFPDPSCQIWGPSLSLASLKARYRFLGTPCWATWGANFRLGCMPLVPSMRPCPEHVCSRHALARVGGSREQEDVHWEVTVTCDMGWGVQKRSLSSVDR